MTECLRGLATYGREHDVRILFKGGTSLSKAYGLIRRFSEDADMVVVFGGLSMGYSRKHLKGCISPQRTRHDGLNGRKRPPRGGYREDTRRHPGIPGRIDKPDGRTASEN